MEHVTIPGFDRPISRLVMGTMVCTTDNMPLTMELLDAYVAAGGNCLDTAHVYGGGKTEPAVGRWMAERGNRERVILIGKGAHPRADGLPRVRPAAIAEDIAESLERFQTDCIDLYVLHRDDPDYPVGPIVESLNQHCAAGRIRAFGASNWTHDRIRQANTYAGSLCLAGFVLSSPYFGLARPNEPMWPGCVILDAEGLAWHERTGFPLFPWSSQAGGFFTGRYSPDDRGNADIVRVYYNEDNWRRLERAREMARRKGVTPNQIALAWVLNRPFPVFPLIGPRQVGELQESLGALSIRLTDDELRWLNLEA